jgi:alginate O-acetyltransferase complex protein AlgI
VIRGCLLTSLHFVCWFICLEKLFSSMLFNSFEFLVFFPIVTATYFVLPHRFRWILLLLASCVFYMAFVPVYILILFGIIIIDYTAGRFLDITHGNTRKWVLAGSIVGNLTVLFSFKYFNFVMGNLGGVLGLFGLHAEMPRFSWLLPIGLSFHTFQSLSYTIEVYRGTQKAEKNIGIFALYVMFYPQLVAGPIERPQNLLHQFYEKHAFVYDRVVSGMRLMLWGFFKKLVIADRLAIFVNQVYDSPREFTGVPLILATYFFAFQIYCDFSAYTDIARGAARVMGFNLIENFDRPYFAKSIAEFWRRWHMSLSFWFRDYLYLPLGGNRGSYARVCFNILTVFILSGLWHGASWTFLFWGFLNGVYLITSKWTEGFREQILMKSGLQMYPTTLKCIRVFFVFHLVCFAWIFFRANSFTDAIYIVQHLFDGIYEEVLNYSKTAAQLTSMQLGKNGLLMSLVCIVLLLTIHLAERVQSLPALIASQKITARWIVYFGTVFVILGFGVFAHQKFIYFQF